MHSDPGWSNVIHSIRKSMVVHAAIKILFTIQIGNVSLFGRGGGDTCIFSKSAGTISSGLCDSYRYMYKVMLFTVAVYWQYM